MKQHVHIVDYGLGNLHSVAKALEFVGANVSTTTHGAQLHDAERIVIPGVGAFADGMAGLLNRGFVDAIQAAAHRGAAILGICLGAQLLMQESDEFGTTQGLSLIEGRVERIPPTIRVPHVGWAPLSSIRPNDWAASPLKHMHEGQHVYFVHSYHIRPTAANQVLAIAKTGHEQITAAVGKGRVWGLQFHPEKSGKDALVILKDFLS